LFLKKLDLRGVRVRQPPGIILRRRHTHAGLETPQIPAPPIHSGIVAHVRNDRDLALDLCFGVGQMRGLFLTTTRNSLLRGVEPRT
jgi:hypothetical protein